MPDLELIGRTDHDQQAQAIISLAKTCGYANTACPRRLTLLIKNLHHP